MDKVIITPISEVLMGELPLYMHVYLYMCIHMYIYIYVFICICINTYIYIYVCIYFLLYNRPIATSNVDKNEIRSYDGEVSDITAASIKFFQGPFVPSLGPSQGPVSACWESTGSDMHIYVYMYVYIYICI
jgi:hypothetical protein